VSAYTVYITSPALAEAKQLPGNVRQRVKRTIDDLQLEPRPSGSKQLEFPEASEVSAVEIEVRRLRLDKWRILYTIHEEQKIVDVLAIRKRPPYDYGDLGDLLKETGNE